VQFAVFIEYLFKKKKLETPAFFHQNILQKKSKYRINEWFITQRAHNTATLSLSVLNLAYLSSVHSYRDFIQYKQIIQAELRNKKNFSHDRFFSVKNKYTDCA